MKSITEIYEILLENKIYMPLPWVDYDDDFCCGSCVGTALASGDYRHEGNIGAMWCCVQNLEQFEKKSEGSIYFNWGLFEGDNTVEFGQRIVDILKENRIDYEWDGQTQDAIRINGILIDKTEREWIDEQLRDLDEDEDEDEDENY